MNSEFEAETNETIDDFTEMGREKLRVAQEGAEDALAAVTGYIRANPWVAVGAAALLGGAIAVLSKHRDTPPNRTEAVRAWLDDAYANLPSQKQVRATVDSTGVPDFLKQLKKKLNLG